MRPYLLTLGSFRLPSYGVLLVLGGFAAFAFLRRRAAALGLKTADDFWLLVDAILAGGFLGGRLLYVLEYARGADFWRALISPSRGFSVLGAFAGVPLAVWLFARARGLSFARLLDTVCVMAPLWHAFGRVGCLLAGCCYGVHTDLPWGIPMAGDPSRHPTQVYEAVANLLLAAGLYRLLVKSERSAPGLVAGVYFASYGVLRFFEEFLRGDSVPLAAGWTAGQGLGAALVIASCAWLARRPACFRLS